MRGLEAVSAYLLGVWRKLRRLPGGSGSASERVPNKETAPICRVEVTLCTLPHIAVKVFILGIKLEGQ